MIRLRVVTCHWPIGMAVALAFAPALAAAADSAATAAYQKERAACLDGNSPQDRSTCLKEAGAVLAESRRASSRPVGSEQASSLAANAVQRCKAVPAEDRNDCERRARGEGASSGSVAGGGVLTQVVTPVAAPVKP